jgi:hypothetical protein
MLHEQAPDQAPNRSITTTRWRRLRQRTEERVPQWREGASERARREATAAATREETDDGGRENRKGRKITL